MNLDWLKKLLGINKKENDGTIPVDSSLIAVETENTEEEEDMKYLVVGLGNMEFKYENTRHNVGFKAVDALVEGKNKSYEIVKFGLQAELKHKGRTIFIHKPNTYMNLSGKAVKYWMDKLKIKRENLLIITDDIHTDFETIRLRAKGSSAGHNGLKDIEEKLGGTNYPRLKIGVGADFGKGRQVDYVLSKWSTNESRALPEILDRCVAAILDFTSIGINRAMSAHNKKV